MRDDRFKVYVAGSYARKSELRVWADRLRASGVYITSSWLDEPDQPHNALQDTPDPELWSYAAIRNMTEVMASDLVVRMGEDPKQPRVGGGKFVEMGAALAMGIKVHLVTGHSRYETIFDYMPKPYVVVHRSFEAFEEWLLNHLLDREEEAT